MGKTEIVTFVVLINLILLIFIGSILFFIFQYRKRKLEYEKEKATINETHQIELLNTQLESQRQTMQFIGQEIHDSVAQKLTLASIYVQKLEFEKHDGLMESKIMPINKIINDSLMELRLLSKNLTDANLQHLTLEQLIQSECDRVNATGLCTAKLTCNDVIELRVALKSSVLRIVQEFLQNSLKHSGCKQIVIDIQYQHELLHISMHDDGTGFKLNETVDNGIGLDNIRRRIQHLEGKYELKTEPGNGTNLTLFIPLK